jgi:hypothetical protein
MTVSRCSCGFTELDDETMTDHLLGAFIPEDGIAGDGVLHEEGRSPHACLCGLAAATSEQLDQHYLAVFTPEDRTGLDGKVHTLQP